MQVTKYIFCGCAVELICEEPLTEESTFSLFRSDFDSADYSLKVIKTDSLPPKDGTELFASDRRKAYFNGRTNEYTAYYDVVQKKYIDFACKTDGSVLYVSYPGKLREVTVFDGINLPEMLLGKGVGILHCSFIEYQGNAILFAGDKQVGKSTQASLWQKHRNAEIINGDRAAIVSENGKIYACGIPFCGTSKICKNKKLPLKAIICLSKGEANRVERLSPFNAFMAVLGKFTYECRSEASSNKISALVETIAENTPVYSYTCLNAESAVEYLERNIL